MRIAQDIKFGFRMLLRDPGFTAVMVAALALGIGVNTTIFTLVNAVLFRGLPFEQAHRVMYLSSGNPARSENDMPLSYPDFQDWKSQNKTFKGLAAYSQQSMVITDAFNAPERYVGPRVTSNFFSLIGQSPMLGRDFLPAEDHPGAAPVCILGYGVWDSRYGRNPNILGQTIRINDAPATIVGIMPKGMKFPINAEIWLPLIPTADYQKRDNRNVQAFGRLADGVTLSQARADLDVTARHLARQYPKEDQGIVPKVIPYNDAYNGGNIRTVFLALLGAVGFVLLIACANVANLLLARSLARAREISIRTALGASRWRVIRQLLIESVMVGILGGLAGLLIAVWGVRMFDLAVANVGKPYWIDFRMDFTVFAYLAVICLVTGILFGLAPAIQLSNVDLNSTLKEGGRGPGGSRRARLLSSCLVVTEIALSLVLLVGAGLMVRSFLNIYNMTSGLHGERYLTMRLSLPDKRYPTDALRLKFYEQLEPRILGAPGVVSAAFVSHLPINGSFDWKVEIEGQPPVDQKRQKGISAVVVSPGYFQTINIPLLRGRNFTNTDGLQDQAAVIINQRFAAKYWPNQDPLGKRLRVLWPEPERPWLTVIAVAQDFRQSRPDADSIDPLLYLPYRARPVQGYALLIRSAVAPTSLTSAMRKQIQAVDANLPVFAAMTLEESLDQQRWAFRVFGTLFAVFALIALLLSSVGLYAMMSYAVTRRTQEIGVRIAMGASSGSILYLVVSQGIRQLMIGLAIGLAGAFALARVLKTLLIQVTPTDPATFITISAILIAVGLLACWLPARSATKVDPLSALRYE